jgi:tRNA(Ile2) C34 agmatinyltransferase TiaS
MSAVAAPQWARPASGIKLAGGLRPFDDRATLESVILSAWEGLVVEGRCACPVCGSEMAADAGAGRGDAECSGCGAELR